MFDSWANGARGIFDSVLPLYRDTDFAYAVAGWMTAIAAVLVIVALISHASRVAAIRLRLAAITSFISFESKGGSRSAADEREAQFAARFVEIDRRLEEGGILGAALAHAWRRYRRTLAFVGAPPIRSSQHPYGFFLSAMPPPSWLGFSANILVAIGLLATFLGLVAALSFASEGMASNDVNAMQASLRDLLAAASSKFVTSVAGVGLSIVLRLAERFIAAHLRARIEDLSSALEFGIRVDPEAHSAAMADRFLKLKDASESQSNE